MLAIEHPWDMMVYRRLRAAADEGLRCPSSEELRELIGCASINAPVKVVQRLERQGAIQVERYQRERRVTIVATGKSTAPVKTPAPHWRTQPRPTSMPSISPTYLTKRRADMGARFVAAAREEGLSVQDFIAELVWTGWQAREVQRSE